MSDLSAVVEALGRIGDPRGVSLCRAEAERKLLSRRRSGAAISVCGGGGAAAAGGGVRDEGGGDEAVSREGDPGRKDAAEVVARGD
jgi:hypothetical protein